MRCDVPNLKDASKFKQSVVLIKSEIHKTYKISQKYYRQSYELKSKDVQDKIMEILN